MRCRNDAPWIAALCLLLAGCATTAVDMAPPRPDRPWTPQTDAHGGIIAGATPAAAASSAGTWTLPANHALAEVPGKVLPERTQPYTLAELIDLAESLNPATRVAWNDARRAALATGIARSAYLPHLAASALAGHHSGSHEGILGNTSGNGSAAFVSLQWLLFDFGERKALVDAAREGSAISNITFSAAHQKVIHDVSVAFYAYQAARARVATAAASLKNAKVIEDAADARHRRGVATVMETAQAHQATAQARLAVVTSRGNEENAYQDLLAAVGVSPLTKIGIVDLGERKLPAESSASLDQVIRDALSRRPDVLAAASGVKLAEAQVRAAKAAFLPRVFLYANEGHYRNNLGISPTPVFGQGLPTVNFRDSGWAGGIFLGVTVPLYDGGMRAAQVGRAKLAAHNAELKLDQVRQAAARQVVRATNTLRSSLEAWHAASALQAASQTTFDAALAAYRNGVGNLTELNSAEIQLNAARNAASDAHSAALSAAATLALAIGSPDGAP